MGRKSNTEERRVQIVAALRSVMKEKGYEKASIQSIAKNAGLAPGLIHYHFKTKQEILIALVEQIVDHAETRFENMLANCDSPQEKLEALIDARLGFGAGADESAVAAWVVIGAEAVRQPEVRKVYQKVIQRQLDLINECITQILTTEKKSTEIALPLAASVVANMEGAFQLSAAAEDIMPKSYAAEMLKKQLSSVLLGVSNLSTSE